MAEVLTPSQAYWRKYYQDHKEERLEAQRRYKEKKKRQLQAMKQRLEELGEEVPHETTSNA